MDERELARVGLMHCECGELVPVEDGCCHRCHRAAKRCDQYERELFNQGSEYEHMVRGF